MGESIKEPSTIDEQGTLCNMDLKCQMRKKKSNKMKERKKSNKMKERKKVIK